MFNVVVAFLFSNISDDIWDNYQAKTLRAYEEQAAGGLLITNHPDPDVGATFFVRTSPDANGRPHFQNATFHLFLSNDKDWKLSTNFTPEANQCNSYFPSTFLGLIPEGKSRWTVCTSGKWADIPITVTRLSVADLEEKKRAQREALAEQAAGTLTFSGGPPHVNGSTFRRSTSSPDANGYPVFDNGTCHLFVSAGKWRLSAGFDPTSTKCSCCAPISKPYGCVPIGVNEWDSYDDTVKGWIVISIEVTQRKP